MGEEEVREAEGELAARGAADLVVDVWLRTPHDVHTIVAHVSHRLPRLTVNDRSVVLRTVKHTGRLLDRGGHSVGVVPLRHPED